MKVNIYLLNTYHIFINLFNLGLSCQHSIFLSGDNNFVALRGRGRDMNSGASFSAKGRSTLAIRALDEWVIRFRNGDPFKSFT